MTIEKKKKLDKRQGRRAFLRLFVAWPLRLAALWIVIFGVARLGGSRAALRGARRPLGILRPPGAQAEEVFLAACIRCTRCSDACSANAIRFFGRDGGTLQATPYIDPIAQACTMCLACGEACPTEALLPLREIEEVAMGMAQIDDRLCVSINGTGICGACFTVCPLRGKAISQGIRNAPTVHSEHCTGCGLCEQFCIVDERPGLRAIQVVTKRGDARLIEAT